MSVKNSNAQGSMLTVPGGILRMPLVRPVEKRI
jgi:hypothetical protein